MKSKYEGSSPRLLLLMLASLVSRDQGAIIDYLREDSRVLRELLGSRRLPLTDAQRRRLAIVAKEVPRRRLLELGPLVTPDTLLRWFRRLVAAKYDGSAKRRGGRAPKPQEVRELVVQLARDNEGWGYTKIRDVVRVLGHEISRTTVRRILKEADLHPSPERLKHMPWATFLKAHWGAIAAMDFFQIEVMTLTGPVRYAVLVVMDLKSRRVEVAGIVQDAYEEWMIQMVRNLTDAVDGFLLEKTHLIMDRDPVFSRDVREMLTHAGVRPVRLPRRSPTVRAKVHASGALQGSQRVQRTLVNLNAHVERFVRSIKEECLSRVIPLGERHLRHLVREYLEHYHAERPHQGLDGSIITPANDNDGEGRVVRRQRLGGLLNHYYRKAA